MKISVTLAYEYDGHKADSTVSLDEDEARRLVRTGRARVPDASPKREATKTPAKKAAAKKTAAKKAAEPAPTADTGTE